MKECQIKPYIQSSTSDMMEQQRLNSIHNEVFRRLIASKLFRSWDGKLWEFKNKGVSALNKGRQLVGQINRDYGSVIVKSGDPVKVDVRPLLSVENPILIQQGNQFISQGEIFPTLEDAQNNLEEDVVKDIYSEIGMTKYSLIPSEFKEEIQTKVDEYNKLNTEKELYLHEVVGKYIIKEKYKANYLATSNEVIENISEEYSPSNSMSNFNLPCIKG